MVRRGHAPARPDSYKCYSVSPSLRDAQGHISMCTNLDKAFEIRMVIKDTNSTVIADLIRNLLTKNCRYTLILVHMAAFNKKIAGQARNDSPLAPLDYLKLVHMGMCPCASRRLGKTL